MKIIFFGSGDFAAPILHLLLQKNTILCVLTTEKQPAVSRKKIPMPVSTLALQNNIATMTVAKITPEIIAQLQAMQPDILVVASYGLLLPSALLAIGKFPPLNAHPSSLPKYRGAAPIERAIERGETEIDLCIIEVVAKLDAGDIFTKQNIPLLPNYTALSLMKIASEISAQMTQETINNFANNVINRTQQNEQPLLYAKKIEKHELLLDFSQDCGVICNKIRAFDTYGGCYFIHNNERIKVFGCTFVAQEHSQPLGTINANISAIYCNNGYIVPEYLQRDGKKILAAKDVLRGIK
jgi:methionyl-tRNA formyltransferase